MKKQINFKLGLSSIVLLFGLIAYLLVSKAARRSFEATFLPSQMTWKTCYFLSVETTAQEPLVEMKRKENSFWPLRSQFCDSSSLFTSTTNQPVEVTGDFSMNVNEGSTFTFWFLPAPQLLSQDLFSSSATSESYLIQNGTWTQKEE